MCTVDERRQSPAARPLCSLLQAVRIKPKSTPQSNLGRRAVGTGGLVITPQLTFTQATLGVGHQSKLGEKPACETRRRKKGEEKLQTPASTQARSRLWTTMNCGEEVLQGQSPQ